MSTNNIHFDLNQIIFNSKNDFLALKGARLFITGGTGYIGRWLLESLCYANIQLSLGLKLVVLSRNPSDFLATSKHMASDPAVTFITGDVRTFDYPEGEFTHAIHAATDVILTQQPLDIFDVTVYGTRQVLKFCKERGVSDVLLLSSGAVYGPIPYNMTTVSEEYSGSPKNDALGSAYGIGKIATEWLGTAYTDEFGMACKSARVFAQVGPFLPLDKQFAAGNFILNALKKECFVIKGDGSPHRSYMYATDLITWLIAILVRGQGARAYNVGSDHSISIRDLAALIATVSGIDSPEIKILTEPSDKPHERYVPNVTRAQNELDLVIRVPLEEALDRTIRWYKF